MSTGNNFFNEPFSYGAGWIVLFAFLTVGLATAAVLIKFVPIWKAKARKPKLVQTEVKKPEVLVVPGTAKRRYLTLITKVENDLAAGRITTRDAYQQMSFCTKGFFQEVTGVDVSTYTLEEIHALGIPQLEYLVNEYYAPEFAPEYNGDVRASMEKTKRVISQWN